VFQKYFAFLILFSFQGLVFAQVLKLKDLDSFLPIKEAVIESKRLKQHAVICDDSGHCDMRGFREFDELYISALGYQTRTTNLSEIRTLGNTFYLTSLFFELNPIAISVSRWGDQQKNHSAKTISIIKKQKDLLLPQTAADLLGASGHVFIQKSQQGGGSPMIRGFSSNRLLYVVDGVRMNTAIFRAGNLHNLISLDPFAIENIDVFFGPGSVAFGSDAIGGVMSFNTLQTAFSQEKKPTVSGRATSRYSSANQEQSHHFHTQISHKRWAILSSFSTQNYKDLRMGNRGGDASYLRNFYVQQIDSADRIIQNKDPLLQVNTAFKQINLMQKIAFKASNHLKLELALHYSEIAAFDRYDRLIETQNGLPVSAVWQYGPQKWFMGAFSLTHAKTHLLYDFLSVKLAQQDFEESRIDRNFSGANRFRLRTTKEQVAAYSSNVDFRKIHGYKRFYYGLEWVFNDVNSEAQGRDIRNNNSIPVAVRYPQAKWQSYAAYFNFDYKLNNALTLQSGLRYNRFSIASDFSKNLPFYTLAETKNNLQSGSFAASLGLIYKAKKHLQLRANLSNGFRLPNVDDLGKTFEFVNQTVVVPNPSLQAEYAYNAETGCFYSFKDRFRIDLSVYYTLLNNALVRRDYQLNGSDSLLVDGVLNRMQAIQNAAQATVYGLQLDAEVKLPQDFFINLKANYQKGVEEMEDGSSSASRHAAPFFATAAFEYRLPTFQWRLYGIYNGQIRAANLNVEEQAKPHLYAKDKMGEPHSPAWFTFNCKVLYRFYANWTISAGIENIFDARYRPYSSGIVAPGRNFVIQMQLNF
jgi:hemoglobin/transferrin/lactoferrin receptor protein